MGGQAKRKLNRLVRKFGWQVSEGPPLSGDGTYDNPYVWDSHHYLLGICPKCFNYERILEPWPIEDKKVERQLQREAVGSHVCGSVNEFGKRDWGRVL